MQKTSGYFFIYALGIVTAPCRSSILQQEALFHCSFFGVLARHYTTASLITHQTCPIQPPKPSTAQLNGGIVRQPSHGITPIKPFAARQSYGRA